MEIVNGIDIDGNFVKAMYVGQVSMHLLCRYKRQSRARGT